MSFKTDILHHLSLSEKKIPSKYFYDKHGDKLFEDIMSLEEYYLTRCENEIFETQHTQIINAFKFTSKFELIELGAGNGEKTLHLLRSLHQHNFSFNYIPIDISRNVLNILKDKVTSHIPEINISPKIGDYFSIISSFSNSSKPKVILFLGSNIGNLSISEAKYFMSLLANHLNTNDKILLGVDLIKDESIILPAYNDSKGVTKQFNLNLLNRINKELGANFNLNQFEHIAKYSNGAARSYLKSLKHQQVTIGDSTIDFRADELIQTEISQKYDNERMHEIIKNTGLSISHRFTDSKTYFCNFLLNKE